MGHNPLPASHRKRPIPHLTLYGSPAYCCGALCGRRGTNRSVCPVWARPVWPGNSGREWAAPVHPASSRAGALCPASWFRSHPRRPGLDRTPQPGNSCRAHPGGAARGAGRPYENRLENSLPGQAVEEAVKGTFRTGLSRQSVSFGAGFQESGDPGRGRRLSGGGLAPVIGVEDPGYVYPHRPDRAPGPFHTLHGSRSVGATTLSGLGCTLPMACAAG